MGNKLFYCNTSKVHLRQKSRPKKRHGQLKKTPNLSLFFFFNSFTNLEQSEHNYFNHNRVVLILPAFMLFMLLSHEMTFIQLRIQEAKGNKSIRSMPATKHTLNQCRSLNQTIFLLSTNTSGIKQYFLSCGYSARVHVTFLLQ